MGMTFFHRILLLTLFLFCFVVKKGMALQKAIVIAPRLIVYEDSSLKEPLGYIREGKVIHVGVVERRGGTVLPIALQGRIGWIKRSQIRLEKKDSVSGDGSLQRYSENGGRDHLRYRNSFSFSANFLRSPSFSSNHMTPSGGIVSDTLGPERTKGIVYSLLYERKKYWRNLKWYLGFGFDYLKMNSPSFVQKAWGIRGSLALSLMDFSWGSLDILGGLVFSSNYKLQIRSFRVYKGILYGFQYGGMLRFFPNKRLGARVGLYFLTAPLSGLDEIRYQSGNTITSLSGFKDIPLFAGLSYRF